jgi:isopentenyl-diphosphate delta-isomerase
MSTMKPPSAATDSRDRKAEHIQIALDRRMQNHGAFDGYRLVHCALPEIDLATVDTATTFLDKPLAAPLLISCMTGGTDEAARINQNLAIAAERVGVALGVGSQRKALEDSSTRATFEVREHAPSIPLLGNLGAVQFNYGYGIEECRAAVDMIGADALVLHLNPLQEAIQPEGDGDFSDLLPVVVKEIGMGISADVAAALRDVGVRTIDTAGAGGTSWARIEAERADDLEIGELFADWGVPTVDSIRAVAALEDVTVIGSGGVRNGIDMAKAIALGADIVGLAYPFLQAAVESADAVEAKLRRALRELRICMFCTGARDIARDRYCDLAHYPRGASSRAGFGRAAFPRPARGPQRGSRGGDPPRGPRGEARNRSVDHR